MVKISSANSFSSHLFWDIDRNSLDLEKNKKFIVQRVLEYGLIDDWLTLRNLYGIDEIADTATKLRTLEPRALSFISTCSNTPLEKFRCYTTRQSTPTHWYY
jgi:hypothetical protein